MKPIFEYLDYRAFLKDFYEDKKSRQSFFSYRLFGKKVGVDASYLAKVLMNSRHIAEDSIARFSETCGLKDREAEYFENMVRFAKAKTNHEGKVYFEKLLSLKSTSAQRLVADQYEYYRKWHHSAVRSVLEYHEFRGDYKALAAMLSPAITPKEAKESIALLSGLGLIRKDEDGRHRLTEAAITTGSQWKSLAIEAFQEETIRLSAESLKGHPKEHRDVSTVTMNINAADYAELRERVREFRASLINYVSKATDPDRTYQVNIQLFPLSRIGGGAE
ncbi:MAG: hypothetical protein JWP91_3618 [Fibrobacteres bacterium]|nr:hypothetical protein [Fibrobacterota bacterium]